VDSTRVQFLKKGFQRQASCGKPIEAFQSISVLNNSHAGQSVIGNRTKSAFEYIAYVLPDRSKTHEFEGFVDDR